MCTALPLYVNEELRAITKNQRSFDSAVIMSPLIPSEKYSCSGSPLILVKGSTAIAGRSGSGKARGVSSRFSSGGCLTTHATPPPACFTYTATTKQNTFAAQIRLYL